MEKNTKIVLFTGVAAATVGILYWHSKQNEKEGNALLEAIDKSYAQNDTNAAGKQAIQEIQNTKLRNDKIAVGKFYGNIKDPKVSAAYDQLYKDLWASMKGIGTNLNAFYGAFFQIRNKNTAAYIDKMFKVQFGEGLFEMMSKETKLNNAAFGRFSDKTKNEIAIPFYDSYWNPLVAKYLTLLPTYAQLNLTQAQRDSLFKQQ